AGSLDSRESVTSTRRRESGAVALAAWLLWAAPVWAAPGHPGPGGPSVSASSVAVIRPPAGDRVLEEASLRIRSELDAQGTSNRLLDCPGPGTPERPDCADSSSAARIALFREDG